MTTIFKDIIILGAGPTGLMFANQLTRFGVDYTILDQKSGPTDQSRALVVHARSMEIYEQLGLSDQIVADGQLNNGLNLYRNGKQVASVTIVNEDEKASPFPFLMMYEQRKNENLLYHHLLHQDRNVDWNTTIQSIEKEGDTYHLKAMQNGAEITFQCKYLVACDGSKSMARDFAQVPFSGGSYLNIFFVADTHTDAGYSPEKLSLFIRKNGVDILFPMKGAHHFRALGILPKEYYHQDALPFETILKKVEKDIKMPGHFYDTNWHSTYKLHHKKVSQFSKDNIFLVGDAAHVHSPAGGQGMNTGLQDAYNLAWKLALVIQGKAASTLLNTYHEERNPVAEDLLKTTDRLFQGMSTENFLFSIFRMYVVPLVVPFVTKPKAVRKQLFWLISQIKIAYLSSSLSKGQSGKVKAGMRLPYFLIQQNGTPVSIYKIINKENAIPFKILVYNLKEKDFHNLDTKLFKVIILDASIQNSRILIQAGFSGNFAMVIRPDNYIGYISASPTGSDILHFMQNNYSLNID